jgi:thiamine transport system ATP-binding protein
LVTGLTADALRVAYGDTVALDDVTVAVAPGEILAIVGPSGCGKSTLLRTIAGLEVPDAGRVRWDGTDVTRVPPHERGFGLMFQDHALFPHRDVFDNVVFGLRMQHLPRATQQARAASLLELVGLAGFERRSIDTLSGGEAQRVALARALAPSPRLLMLDEPLGSLDRSLRDRLAVDLRAVLREIGQAAIHVTHDQEEAYVIGDRLAVMRAGRIEREGGAPDVWRDPHTEFVARFLGHDNVLDAATAASIALSDGSHAVVVPDVALSQADDGAEAHEASVVDVRFRGATSRVLLEVLRPNAAPVGLVWNTALPPAAGQRIRLAIDRERVAPLVSSPMAPAPPRDP